MWDGLRQYRYPMVLALIAFAILALGLALKPEPKPTARKRPSELAATRVELENLQRLVRRNSLRNLGSQFSSVAEKAADYVLPIANSSQTALAWGPSAVLLPKLEGDLPHSSSVDGSDGRAHDFTANAWVPGVPFVIGSAGSDVTPPSIGGAPAPGDWIVAVSAAQTGVPTFRPGVFNGSAEANCGLVGEKLSSTIPLSGNMAGAGVFDLDARLVGVVLSCDEGMAVIPVAEIQRAARAGLSEPLLARYGMAISGDLGAWKLRDPRASGAVVTEVWNGWPADNAGVKAGDVIVAVDAQAISSEQQAQQLLATDGSHVLDVKHGRRTSRVSLQQVFATQPTQAGALVEEPAPGIGIARVNPGSSAARAGIRSGDRVVEIDGLEATRASVEQTITPFRSSAQAIVVLQRGARRLAVPVAP